MNLKSTSESLPLHRILIYIERLGHVARIGLEVKIRNAPEGLEAVMRYGHLR